MELTLKAVRKTDTGPCSVRTAPIQEDLNASVKDLAQRVPGVACEVDDARSTDDEVTFVLRFPPELEKTAIEAAISDVFEVRCFHVFTTFVDPLSKKGA